MSARYLSYWSLAGVILAVISSWFSGAGPLCFVWSVLVCLTSAPIFGTIWHYEKTLWQTRGFHYAYKPYYGKGMPLVIVICLGIPLLMGMGLSWPWIFPAVVSTFLLLCMVILKVSKEV